MPYQTRGKELGVSIETNKALARRWFEEVWNKRRESAIDEMFAADGLAYGLDPLELHPPPGPGPFKGFWQQFCAAFPDLYITVEDVIGEGDTTSIRISFRGTHLGGNLGVPATGRPISSTGMCFARWRDGQIIEAWNEFDALGLLKQIGLARMNA